MLVSVFIAFLLLGVCRASLGSAAVLTSRGESAVAVRLCVSAAPSLQVQLCSYPSVFIPQSGDIPTWVFSHLSSVCFPVWEFLSTRPYTQWYVPQASSVYAQAHHGHCGFSYSVLFSPSFCLGC